MCASDTSPGFTRRPPPVRAAMLAEWCGARNGRSRVSVPLAIRPAMEWTMEVSSSSAAVSGGSRPGRRWASMDLPEPGGPDIEQVVAAGGGDLQGALGVLLALDVLQVRAARASIIGPGLGWPRIWLPRKWLTRAIRERGARIAVSPAQAASGPQASGQIRPRPQGPGRHGRRQGAGHRGDLAVEVQLADGRPAVQGVLGDDAHHRHQGQGDGQVVVVALLGQVRRGEVGHHAPGGRARPRPAKAARTRSRASRPPPCRPGPRPRRP